MNRSMLSAGLLAAACAVSGCQSAYYGAMEKLGYEKRDLLVGDVKKARGAQDDAKKQFASALEEFTSVLGSPGGELEAKYKKLDAVLKRSESRADAVHARVREVERVATALFREWKAELGQYSSASLRQSSEDQLRATERRYDDLMLAMKRAESRMEPVLKVLRDQVLFLKHNLNAQAIASIKSEIGRVGADVSALVKEMEIAIAEADKFIAAMPQS
ncbi:MAG: DUF2959 domain-containing protein [Verrucomicrobia bacterium]|nr:DUF2959 domain-containing protein [Verrucomicrobiota bacterium]